MRYMFSYFLKKTCCGYSLEVPHRGTSNESTHNIFCLSNKKNVNFWASKSWLDKWILTIVRGQVIKFDNSSTLHLILKYTEAILQINFN